MGIKMGGGGRDGRGLELSILELEAGPMTHQSKSSPHSPTHLGLTLLLTALGGDGGWGKSLLDNCGSFTTAPGTWNQTVVCR